jgi:agarase
MPPPGDAPLTPPNPGEFRWGLARGAAGFFRAAPDAAGRWWLVDGANRPFFCKAVHGVRAVAPVADGSSAAPFAVERTDVAARLRRWGFNAAGAGGDGAAQADGLAYFATVDFCRAGPLIHAPGARLPDVFDPEWPRRAAERAHERCAPLADDAALIGWVTDDALGWAQPAAPADARGGALGDTPAAGAPTLLQICLSLEPTFTAYHAAWEFVFALHGGKLAAVARAWGTPLANKEIVRELTRAEQGVGTRGYLRDQARWTREFARRYFATAGEAIRAADPHHLVLGARGAGPTAESVRAESVYPAVDVPLVEWTALPAHATGPAGTGSGPVLADEVCWAEESFLRPSTGAARLGSPLAAITQALRRLTTVERMLRRGRTALERAARHPAVVGYVWRQWLDEPGEQPPFARGLVHVNGAEAREHTELLAEFNARAETVRGAARPGLAAPETLSA